jgi:tetratricopeptide (TPR) repeat protein
MDMKGGLPNEQPDDGSDIDWQRLFADIGPGEFPADDDDAADSPPAVWNEGLESVFSTNAVIEAACTEDMNSFLVDVMQQSEAVDTRTSIWAGRILEDKVADAVDVGDVARGEQWLEAIQEQDRGAFPLISACILLGDAGSEKADVTFDAVLTAEREEKFHEALFSDPSAPEYYEDVDITSPALLAAMTIYDQTSKPVLDLIEKYGVNDEQKWGLAVTYHCDKVILQAPDAAEHQRQFEAAVERLIDPQAFSAEFMCRKLASSEVMDGLDTARQAAAVQTVLDRAERDELPVTLEMVTYMQEMATVLARHSQSSDEQVQGLKSLSERYAAGLTLDDAGRYQVAQGALSLALQLNLRQGLPAQEVIDRLNDDLRQLLDMDMPDEYDGTDETMFYNRDSVVAERNMYIAQIAMEYAGVGKFSEARQYIDNLPDEMRHSSLEACLAKAVTNDDIDAIMPIEIADSTLGLPVDPLLVTQFNIARARVNHDVPQMVRMAAECAEQVNAQVSLTAPAYTELLLRSYKNVAQEDSAAAMQVARNALAQLRAAGGPTQYIARFSTELIVGGDTAEAQAAYSYIKTLDDPTTRVALLFDLKQALRQRAKMT